MNLRPTLVKLTLGYLLMIMMVSTALSFTVYAVGTRPLDRRVELGQRIFIEEEFPPGFPREEMRPRLNPFVADAVKRRLKVMLVYFNVAVFCLAGVLSYALAKRELRPMEEAFELQSRFTSDAAHELRTPLTAMKAEIEVALRGAALDESETRKLLESNLEEIAKLETLSGGLLKLAQYELGGTGLQTGGVDLVSLVQESVDRVRHQAVRRSMEITLELQQATVTGDRDTLVEMLVILLDNSVKFSGENTTVTVTAARQKHHVEITVADQGYGIEKADLPRVFDRFYRGTLPASRGKVSGYGLGLPIARRIAEVHHGSITLASEPGRGTRATVRLPLAHESRAR